MRAAVLDTTTALTSYVKAAFNLLLILVTSLVCLVAAEALTRTILDEGMLYELEMWKYAREVKIRDPRPDLGHRHQPRAEARLMDVDVRTNAQGLRGPEISETPAAGVAATGRKVDGFNLGVGNYNTTQELALFREIGAKLVVFDLPELRELAPYPFGDITAKVRAIVEGERRVVPRPVADGPAPAAGQPVGNGARPASQRQCDAGLHHRHDPAPVATARRAVPQHRPALLTIAA